MAYRKKKYELLNTIEYELKFKGKYGGKGEKRAERRKATAEQMAYQNQRNKEIKVRRLLEANFYKNDLWVCLKYPAGTRKPYEEVKKDLTHFLRNMRRDYKARGEPFKYIYRVEVGEKGGIHIHIVINKIWESDVLLVKNWGKHLNITPVYGDFNSLAKYIVKPIPEESKQLSLFPETEKTIKRMAAYSSSRNLVRPSPEVKEYRRRKVEKLIREGPEASPGYYIDKLSIRVGVNPYTGYSYMTWQEHKIKPSERKLKPPWSKERQDAG